MVDELEIICEHCKDYLITLNSNLKLCDYKAFCDKQLSFGNVYFCKQLSKLEPTIYTK